MSQEPFSVLVIGAGAIGAFYGAALARQGARVDVVCRSDFEVVQRDGFFIRSASLGDHAFRPDRVFASGTAYDLAPDYVILSVKVLPDVDRVALLRPVLGPHTAIVLIQNGIDIEREIADALPEHELISALAFVGVSRTAPGQIWHQTRGELILGSYPRGLTPAARRLAAAFERAGISSKPTDDVVTARWQKAVWNAPFNPISILGDGLDTKTILADEDGVACVRRAMHEVVAIAAATGHALPSGLVEPYIEGSRAMPAYKTSMALDREHGRPLELEAILGNVVRAGRTAQVACPTLETLYALAKMVERTTPGR